MTILITFFFLNLSLPTTYSHFYNDEPCYLTDFERNELEKLAAELRIATGVNVIYVCRRKKVGDGSYHKDRLVIYLAEDPKQRSMQSRQNAMFLKQEYLDQLSIQFLEQGARNQELLKSVGYVNSDIIRLWEYRMDLSERPKEDEGDNMSYEFWRVIQVYSILLVIYGIWVGVKWNNKSHNKAEYWEHFGYSRFSVGLQYSLWILVFAGYVFLLYNYVYYYSEIFILLIPLAFLMRPSVMLLSSVLSMIVDWNTDIPIESSSQIGPSLGQKCFLLDPKKETEELILLDLLELIVAGVVNVSPELKDGRYGSNKYHNFFSLNRQSPQGAISQFQEEVLYELKYGKEHKVASELIENLIYEIGSFKEIRKDLFIKDLVRLGYISKRSWVLNQFKLTDNGHTFKMELSSSVSNMEKVIEDAFSDSSALQKVNREVFLLTDFETKIEELYNHLVNTRNFHERSISEIGPVLEQSFSFYEIRSAIQRQIKKIHRSYTVDQESQMGSTEWA